jgi:poly(beta-D-mannuronate) lyase
MFLITTIPSWSFAVTKIFTHTLITALMVLPNVALAYPARSEDSAKCFDAGEKEALRKNVARTQVTGCTHDIVKPVSTIDSDDVYVNDGTYSIYDCAKYRSSYKKRLNTSMGLDELLDDARVALDNPGTQAAQKCVINTLHEWAEAAGYSKIPAGSANGANIRAWNMGSMAAIYLKNQTAVALAKSLGKHDKIVAWFKARGRQILDDANGNGNRNNLYYWRGFALLTLGIASEDVDMIAKSKSIFNRAISDIDGNGYLPLELARKNKAVHYHQFALEPILGMVAYSKAIDCGFLRSSQEGALELLIRKLARAEQDYSIFKEKTGVAQTNPDEIAPEKFLVLLGDDAQAMRMLANIEAHMVSKGQHLKPARTPAAAGQLGGTTLYTPAPGTLPVTNSAIKTFCN